MVEHTVVIQSMGGATVLSCDALGILNIEHPYSEITGESIKKTILDYKYMKEADADFDLKVVDARPAPRNFNQERDEESKTFKKSHNQMYSHKQ